MARFQELALQLNFAAGLQAGKRCELVAFGGFEAFAHERQIERDVFLKRLTRFSFEALFDFGWLHAVLDAIFAISLPLAREFAAEFLTALLRRFVEQSLGHGSVQALAKRAARGVFGGFAFARRDG